MKLQLTVSDEQQMRDWVKDLIRGQVESILRNDLKEIIGQSIVQSSYPQTEADMKVLIAQQIKEVVRQQLATPMRGFNSQTFIQEIAREEIAELIREMFKDGRAV